MSNKKDIVQHPCKDIVYSTIGFPKSIQNVLLTEIDCPICKTRMEIAEVNMSEIRGDSRTIHLSCPECSTILSVIETDSTIIFGQ